MRVLVIFLFLSIVSSISSTAIHAIRHRPNPINIGFRRALSSKDLETLNTKKKLLSEELRGGAKKVSVRKPCSLLSWAYRVCGIGVTAAWSTIVYTTIRSNQPKGMLMPNAQHGIFARIGAVSAASLMIGSYSTLSTAASSDSWDQLSSTTCRRQNLAIATAGIGSALWVNFADIITRIPGTDPVLSHQAYSGPLKYVLIAAYTSAAVLSAEVWRQSLPEDVRNKPLTWPCRVADGVTKSLVSMAPSDNNNPVNVKYSLLTSGFLFFTGLQLVGQHPTTVIPSWTARRLARAFPAWTLLAAVTCFDLKEATENGRLLVESNYRNLSNGVKGFGSIYLGARFGAVFIDPSWPGSYHAVTQVPGWAVLAIIMMGYTQRSDNP